MTTTEHTPNTPQRSVDLGTTADESRMPDSLKVEETT